MPVGQGLRNPSLTNTVMSGHGGNAGTPLLLTVSEPQRLYMQLGALEKIIRREVTKPFLFLYQLTKHEELTGSTYSSLKQVPDTPHWALPWSLGTRSPRDANVD